MAVVPVPCSGDAEAVPLAAVPMAGAAQLTEAVPPARAVLLAEPAATHKASGLFADASFPPASSGPAGDEAGAAEGQGPTWGQRLRGWWATAASLRSAEGRRRFWRDPANRQAMTLLGWGSLAGAACGVMAGLTGAAGRGWGWGLGSVGTCGEYGLRFRVCGVVGGLTGVAGVRDEEVWESAGSVGLRVARGRGMRHHDGAHRVEVRERFRHWGNEKWKWRGLSDS